MSSREDDDALSWDGDDDPTLTTGRDAVPAAPSRTPRRSALNSAGAQASSANPTVEPAPAAATPAPATPAAATPAPATPASPDDPGDGAPALGNAALVAFGVLGGVYLLYAVGWLVGAQRLVGRAPYLLGDVMFQGSAWLAALAPVLWFAAVLLFTRGQKPWVRFVWLAAGVVLLVPWPFAMLGSVGA